MSQQEEQSLPKRVVRTITLTEDDLNMLDEVERVLSKTGHRVKTDSKLIRAAINVASRVLHGILHSIFPGLFPFAQGYGSNELNSSYLMALHGHTKTFFWLAQNFQNHLGRRKNLVVQGL